LPGANAIEDHVSANIGWWRSYLVFASRRANVNAGRIQAGVGTIKCMRPSGQLQRRYASGGMLSALR
jgi:hypothetical protein